LRLYLGMSRPLRFVPSRSLVLVTQRTFQGRLLLRPSPELNDLFLGLLGKSQEDHGLVIHACVALSNHFHLLVSPRDAHQLADFMAVFTSRLAKEVGRLHGWEGPVFPERYRAHVVSDEEAAQVERLRYILSHGCKEGLVARPEEWPGVHCAGALANARPLSGSWIDRSAWCEARRRHAPPDLNAFRHRVEVHLSPLPCWVELSAERYQARISEMLVEIAAAYAEARRRSGATVMGTGRVLRQNPHEPVPPPEPRRSPLLLAVSPEARQAFLSAYRGFVLAFRAAAQQLKEGVLSVQFPPGSFPPSLPRPSG
jgi:hypothetical protein